MTTHHFDVQGTIKMLVDSQLGVLSFEVPAMTYTESRKSLLRYYAKKASRSITIFERERSGRVLIVLILN
jgi:hypothetical protein